MMELEKAIKGRRSVRIFTDIKVEEAKLKKVLEAGMWAPSACNKQAWHFIVVKKKETVDRLSVAGGPPFLKNAPVIVYVLYRSDITELYNANIQSASAAVQNMLLTAHSLGLGSVWLCEFGNRKKIADILRIPEKHMLVCAVLLGYGKETPKAPKRVNMESVVHEETFSGGGKKMTTLPEDWNNKEIMEYRENGIRATSPTSNAMLPSFRKEFDEEVKIISGMIKDGVVLDILSFSGNHMLNIAARKGLKTVHVYETSRQVAEFIKKKQNDMGNKTRLLFSFSGIGKIPYDDNKFDSVLCVKKLEMLPDPDSMMNEMKRVLKPGGKLIISFWNSRSIYGLNYKIKTVLKKDVSIPSNEGPVKPISIGRIKRMVKNSGLEVMDVMGINIIPKKLQAYSTKGPLKNITRTVVISAVKP